jgi:hypothetical protein
MVGRERRVVAGLCHRHEGSGVREHPSHPLLRDRWSLTRRAPWEWMHHHPVPKITANPVGKFICKNLVAGYYPRPRGVASGLINNP